MKIMVTAAALLIAGAACADASRVTVTSRQFVAAYEANQAVASQKYEGVRLTVSGTVIAIVMNADL
jgi:hypothetical protein